MPTHGVEIGGGFTEGELKFASFWVRNRIPLTRGGYIALMAINALVWGYSAWGVLDAYAISYPREARITSEIAENEITLEALETDRPRGVQSGNVAVFETTDKRFDMAVDLENTNEQWWAEFNYRFNISGEQTPARNGFILPVSRTLLTELGYRPKNRGGSVAQLVVDNIRWHRLDPKVVGEKYKDYELERFNVVFENVKYSSDLTVGSKTVGRTSYDLVNRGAYGYWGMDLVIRLYRGGSTVAINKINLTRIPPGEKRHVELDWFERIPSVTRTEIIPIINFLDPKVYLPTEQF